MSHINASYIAHCTICSNGEGSYTCEFVDGYESVSGSSMGDTALGNTNQCVNIDECTRGTAPCVANSTCIGEFSLAESKNQPGPFFRYCRNVLLRM